MKGIFTTICAILLLSNVFAQQVKSPALDLDDAIAVIEAQGCDPYGFDLSDVEKKRYNIQISEVPKDKQEEYYRGSFSPNLASKIGVYFVNQDDSTVKLNIYLAKNGSMDIPLSLKSPTKEGDCQYECRPLDISEFKPDTDTPLCYVRIVMV